MDTKPRVPRLPLICVFVLAWIVQFPVLFGGFVSDDYWFSFLLDPESEKVHVLWHEAFLDFTRGWPGLEQSLYYRPLITLNFAINFAIGGVSGLVFHASNLLQHSIAVVLCGWLCAVHCPKRPGLAALLGGAVLAVHPTAVEPVAWISSMTSTQELMFRMAALVAYALHLRSEKRASLALALGFAFLAVLTKESAIVLPISLIALEVLAKVPRGRRGAFRRLVPFVALGFAYLLFRRLMPSIVSGGSASFLSAFFGNFFESFPNKLLYLALPFDDSAIGILGTVVVSIGLVFVLLPAVANRHRVALLFGFLAWILLHFATSAHETVHANFYGSRMVYDALPALALGFTILLVGRSEKLRMRPAWALPAILIAGLVLQAVSTRQRIDRYEETWTRVDKLRASLREHGKHASAERPLAIISLPHDEAGNLRIFPDFAFPLAQRPWNDADYPLISLACTLTLLSQSSALHQDAGPIRAMHRYGTPLLVWDKDGQRLQTLGSGRETLAPPSALVEREGSHIFQGPAVDPLACEGLRVKCSPTASRCSVDVLGLDARTALFKLEKVHSRPGALGQDFVFDFTHDARFLAFLNIGIGGFRVQGYEGEKVRKVLQVEAIPRLPTLKLVQPLSGRKLDYRDFERTLEGNVQRPRGLDLRLVLMTPCTAFAVPAKSDGSFEISKEQRGFHRRTIRASRQPRFYYYFEANPPRPGGGTPTPMRSRVDWFTLERVRD